MLSQREIDEAKATDLVQLVARDLPLKRQGAWWVGLCPWHDDSKPSFGVSEKGVFVCFAGCGRGGVVEYVMRSRQLGFEDAVRALAGGSAPKPLARRIRGGGDGRAVSVDPSEQVERILRACHPVTHVTAAALYLWSRGLPPHQPGLRYHPNLYCAEAEKQLPALVAPITTSAGVVTALQRIYLSGRIEYPSDGSAPPDARAAVETRKKSLGDMKDGSVRLQPAAERMGIAEGVETAIAAATLFRMPVWATCGAWRMDRVWIPREVRLLYVFGDNGVEGHKAAEKAVAAHWSRGLECGPVYPDEPFSDFNDQLRGKR